MSTERTLFDIARMRLARWIAGGRRSAPRATGTRMYHNARSSRLTVGWNAPNNSADSELVSSLVTLRARSRALVRDAPYAKRAKIVVVNNIVGTGIGMQAQVKTARGNKLDDAANTAIEEAWAEWCEAESCHTGGRLHFSDMERQLMGQVFEGGEIFIRMHPLRLGRSLVPLALEIVEPERLAEEYTHPLVVGQNIYKLGVEMDGFGRPLRFWMKRWHPSEVRFNSPTTDQLYPVPADQMFHLAVVDRWPQTRGEPWLHAAARRLNDMDGYSEAEIVAARGAASYMGIITNKEGEAELPEPDPNNPTESPNFDLEPGAVEELPPGKEFELVSPNRPNPAMDPFMRMMLREVAAGSHVSYESISGDYSQSNLSSSRMGQQESRDDYRALQQFFIRSFRRRLHREWLQRAMFAGAIPAIDPLQYALNPRRFEAVAFKPRGWAYINPKEDVEAAILAIRAGLGSRTLEIARNGNGVDREDMDELREQEIKAAQEKKLVYTTDPAEFDNAGKKHQAQEEPNAEPQAQPPAARDGTILPMRANHA